jgi:hypothetical protein
MTVRSLLLLAFLLLGFASSPQGAPEPFQPFTPRAYRLVNGVAFDGNEAMIFALLNREVLAHRGRPDSTAPETALFTSQRTPGGWTEPSLLPFSGAFADYEPALSIDGNTLLFNSKRPHADGRTPTRNDLYIVERRGGTWGTPRSLTGINSFDLEESYPTMDSARRVVFVRGAIVEGGDDLDLYEFTLEPHYPVDYEMANYFTSTHPSSPFVQTLTAQRAWPGKRAILRNRDLVLREGKDARTTAIRDPQHLLEVLDRHFGLSFPAGTRFSHPEFS